MFATRWKALGLLASVAAILMLAAACSSSSNNKTTTPGNGASATSPAGASATGSTSAPQQGGSITVQALQPQSFDPHFSAFAQDISIDRMVWRGLYRLDKNNKPQPEMAASQPQVSSDSLTYTVKLQSGLKWSDGAPLTAKDFVAGIVRTCAPDTAGQYTSFLFNIVGCEKYSGDTKADAATQQADQAALGVSAPDDTTIVFKLKNPQATFQIQLAMWFTFPVPTQIIKNPATDKWPDDPTKLAFNGPYKIQSYTQKDNLVLVRNDSYHSASSHEAYLDKITEKYIDDTEQADNAFRAGQVDVAIANLANLKAITSDSSTKDAYFHPSQYSSTLGMQFQMKKAPLDKFQVRLALSQAIDRKTLVGLVGGGTYQPATSWIPGALLGIQDDPFESQIGYNPTEAKKNLSDAGYPDGKGFPTLSLEIRNTPANQAVAAFVQNAYKTVLNINITIKAVDSKTRSADYTSRNFELFAPAGWNQDYPDPEDWVAGQFNTGGSQNFTDCSDPQIDSLMAKAAVNLNNDERIAQYKQINELISTKLCGIAPWWSQTVYDWLVNPKIHGMRDNSTSQDSILPSDWNVENWSVSK